MRSYRRYEFNHLKDSLILMCKENNNYIPCQQDLIKSKLVPHPKTIHEVFEEEIGITYYDYLIDLGFKHPNNRSKFENTTYDDLCDIFEKWKEQNGSYPTEKDCRKRNWLPNWEIIKRIIGDKEYEFRSRFKLPIVPKKEDYPKYEKFFKEESKRLGRPMLWRELDGKNEYSYYLPSGKWMVENCPDENVTSFNNLLEYMGFKPRYLMSKELAIKYINDVYKEKGDLKVEYFKNKENENDLGITTIKNHWGTFNNMLKELGFPINWEKQRDLKSFDELVLDLKTMCEEIKEKENRTIITMSDIDECDHCFSGSMYFSTFKQLYNTTLRNVIDSLGFTLNDAGYGLNYWFDDGELVLSKYELRVSQYLRSIGLKFNKDYKKDVYYKTFIDNYNGRRSIDYIIYNKFYIEVAGIAIHKDYDISKEESNHIKNYKNKLSEKIKMLEKQKLEYYIIYPEDLATKNMDQIFSFLF